MGAAAIGNVAGDQFVQIDFLKLFGFEGFLQVVVRKVLPIEPMRLTPRLVISKYLLESISGCSSARFCRDVLKVLRGLLISCRRVLGIFSKKPLCCLSFSSMLETLRAKSPISSPAFTSQYPPWMQSPRDQYAEAKPDADCECARRPATKMINGRKIANKLSNDSSNTCSKAESVENAKYHRCFAQQSPYQSPDLQTQLDGQPE